MEQRALSLHPHDVLLGRGDWTVRYEGNVRFRDLIREQRGRFGAATGRNARDTIAAEVIAMIAERGGRFLRRQEDEGIPPSESQWFIVDKKVAMKKVKQAFRDKDSWTQIVPPSSATAVTAPLNVSPASRLQAPSLGPAGPYASLDPLGSTSHSQQQLEEEIERTLRVYQTEQQLRRQAEAIRIAARTAELDRLRAQLVEPSRLLQQQQQQTLLSSMQQQQTLQHQQTLLSSMQQQQQLHSSLLFPATYPNAAAFLDTTTQLSRQQQLEVMLQQLQHPSLATTASGFTSFLPYRNSSSNGGEAAWTSDDGNEMAARRSVDRVGDEASAAPESSEQKRTPEDAGRTKKRRRRDK